MTENDEIIKENEERENKVRDLDKSFIMWMTFSPNRMIGFILGVIFTVELAVMYVLDLIHISDKHIEAFVDSASLTVVVTLVFWKTIFAPFRRLARYRDAKSRKDVFESQELFKTLFVYSPFGIAKLDRFGKLIHSNPKFANIMGSTPAELRDQDIPIIFGEDHSSPLMAEFTRIAGEGAATANYKKSMNISGTEKKLDISFYALRDLEGDINGALCILLADPQTPKKK